MIKDSNGRNFCIRPPMKKFFIWKTLYSKSYPSSMVAAAGSSEEEAGRARMRGRARLVAGSFLGVSGGISAVNLWCNRGRLLIWNVFFWGFFQNLRFWENPAIWLILDCTMDSENLIQILEVSFEFFWLQIFQTEILHNLFKRTGPILRCVRGNTLWLLPLYTPYMGIF